VFASQARMTCSARAHTDIKTAINKTEKNSRLRENFLDPETFVFITAPSRVFWPATTKPFPKVRRLPGNPAAVSASALSDLGAT